MAQTVLITLTTAGSDTGPFNLYSNVDGYVIPFESSVAKLDLEAGYTSVLVPDAATTIRVQSNNVTCDNYIDLSIITTTTTTSSTTTTTTSTSTTSTSTTTTTSTSTSTTTSTTTCPTYYQLAACDLSANQYTLIFPVGGVGQRYVLPVGPVFYTYTGGTIVDCTPPSGYNASIQISSGNSGCP